MSSYYVDIHVIQSVPPSNVNRDDTGSPKSALYGGVRRARVSSQAWKKAVRTSFKEFLPANQTGSRTLRVVELLMNRLTAAPYGLPEEDARQKALEVVKALGLKAEKPRKKDESGAEGIERTQYLVFYSNQQLDRLAQLAATTDGKITATDAKKSSRFRPWDRGGVVRAHGGRFKGSQRRLGRAGRPRAEHTRRRDRVRLLHCGR